MNERIKQLAEQYGFVHEHMTTGEKNDALNKFRRAAELIAKECVELCEQVRTQSVSNGSDDYNHGREMGAEICRNIIFKHFGVN